MKSLRLKKEHTADRKKWRGRIRVADPSPPIQARRREERDVQLPSRNICDITKLLGVVLSGILFFNCS